MQHMDPYIYYNQTPFSCSRCSHKDVWIKFMTLDAGITQLSQEI